MSWTHRSRPSQKQYFNGQHRREHWYRDNQVYFVTARCKDKYPAFASVRAKEIWFDRFEHYSKLHAFVPWVATIVNNHYHFLGYLKTGMELKEMMRKLHGSAAKLVNDLLLERQLPFWRDTGTDDDYFDGCIRDEQQCRKAYRYTLIQSVRHGLCKDHRSYLFTKAYIDVDRGVKRALQLNAFMTGVRYKRYDR